MTPFEETTPLFGGHPLPEDAPITVDGMWAKRLFGPGGLVHLDGDGIAYEDNRRVHLVLFGMTPAAEALVLQTLKTAHFPNYIRDHSLRTRITWIDPDALSLGARFVARFPALTEASHYRFVDLEKEEIHPHTPLTDFVDIEWAFVRASGREPLLRSRLSGWTDAESAWRTIVAFAEAEDAKNLASCRALQGILGDAPVLVHLQDEALVPAAGSRFIPFGMPRRVWKNTGLERKIAMAVNAVYTWTAREGRIPDRLDMAEAERLWNTLSPQHRQACLDHAQCLGSKMRSIGRQEEDWKALKNLGAGDLDRLAEVEHNRWAVATLLSGMRPATPEEQALLEKDISLKASFKEKGVHYDLRPYSDLRADENGNDVALYDKALTAGLPLIAHAVTQGTGSIRGSGC